MKIGLVGLPGCGKSTVFGALTGQPVETGYGGSGKANLGVVKVPDERVDALAKLYSPKKTTYAEVVFSDLGRGGTSGSLDRGVLNQMREVDALCQVVRCFPDAAGESASPIDEIETLSTECILADLEIIERRVSRLERDHSSPKELELLQRLAQSLENEIPLRKVELDDNELKTIAGYRFLTLTPLLLVANVPEDQVAEPPADELVAAAKERSLGLVSLSAAVEMDIAQLEPEEQREFLSSLGLEQPASHRFVRAAFELLELISMLTAGADECRAWPVTRGSKAPKAAGKIHSDIERGFIRAEVVPWQELVERGSEAACKEAGVLRVEGKEYLVRDGDVVNFRFNV